MIFIFHRRYADRSRLVVILGNMGTPDRWCLIASTFHALEEVFQVSHQILLIIAQAHPIDSGRSLPIYSAVSLPQPMNVHVMRERRHLAVFLRHLRYPSLFR